jgi:CheY-like chemotaxis protein
MPAINYAEIESTVLELPVESRCRLTHVLIRSIDESTPVDAERESRWLDLAEKVNTAIDDGRMETMDAFDALARIRQSLTRQPR